MMQMNFDLTPPGVAVLRNSIEQAAIVLFRRIKVGMGKGMAIVIPPAIHHLRILAMPRLQAALLLTHRSSLVALPRNDGGLEVIRHGNHQVHRTVHPATQRSPSPSGQNFLAVRDFLPEA